jgi:hypothetical protein
VFEGSCSCVLLLSKYDKEVVENDFRIYFAVSAWVKAPIERYE